MGQYFGADLSFDNVPKLKIDGKRCPHENLNKQNSHKIFKKPYLILSGSVKMGLTTGQLLSRRADVEGEKSDLHV